MKKRKSIHDLARELQVSATTISFVLNGKAREMRIGEALQQRILNHVQETGYQPNIIAQTLRTGKSKILGMLVEGISDPFFSGIARIVEEEAYREGYKLLYSSTDNDPAKARELIKAFQERQVDGYIIAPTPGIDGEIQSILDSKCPVILFDRYMSSVNTTNVIIDNYKGAFNAIRHLIQNGYNNIGFVTLESDQVQMQDRLKGYSDAIKKYRMKACKLQVAYSLAYTENVAAIRRFIQQFPELDAIFFATNYLSIAGLQSMKDLQLSIPADKAVISFDDNSHFNLFSPSISAVAQPLEDMSHEIIKQLKLRLADNNHSLKNETIILETKLIIRESSQPK